jgi:hypothetical protein
LGESTHASNLTFKKKHNKDYINGLKNAMTTIFQLKIKNGLRMLRMQGKNGLVTWREKG